MPSTARAFPIIPRDDEREPTEAERLNLLTEHVHDVLTDNTRLERENAALDRMVKSLTSRTRAMEKALTELSARETTFHTPPHLVRVYTDMARLVIAAQTTEALGDVAACRWARNAAGAIVGVELSYIDGAHAAGEIERCAAEMAVEA